MKPVNHNETSLFTIYFFLYSGYGLGKQFTEHHEVTAIDSTQESEKEVPDNTRHLVSRDRTRHHLV